MSNSSCFPYEMCVAGITGYCTIFVTVRGVPKQFHTMVDGRFTLNEMPDSDLNCYKNSNNKYGNVKTIWIVLVFHAVS